MDTVDTVMRALIGDLRTRFGERFFSAAGQDQAKDITLTPPLEFNEQSRSPQWVITDLTLTPSRWRSNGTLDLNEDRESGTVDEVADPIHRNIEFVVTVVSKKHAEAWAMTEALTVYFGKEPPVLEFTVGEGADAYTFKFVKDLMREFEDRTVPNAGGLRFWEARVRIMDVPIYDGVRTERKLATEVEISVSDQNSGEKLVTADVSVDDE
ncbi:MAG: hypothetical protein WCP22_07950 [Chlamydiota bacterium]